MPATARVLLMDVISASVRKIRSMKNSFKQLRYLLLVAVSGMAACFASPSFAQRNALDLAQAGFLAKDRGEFELAIRLFDNALKQGILEDKQRGFLLYSRGASYDSLGLRDQALADFDAAIVLIPEFPNLYLYRGVIWGDKGQYQRALQDFLTVSRLTPTDPLAFNNLGNVYDRLGDFDQAIVNFDRAISLRSDYAQAYYNRAHTYALKQEKERAIADYDQAISLQPLFSDAYVNRAVLHLMLRDFKAALSDLDTAIRINPKDVTALTNRATINLTMEKYEDALTDYNLALQLHPGNAAIFLGRGRVHLFAGALDSAIADFKTATRLRPNNPYPIIWAHIARVHKGEDDREEFAEAAKNVPRNEWPFVVLGLYLGTEKTESARAAALQGNPADKIKRDCEARFFTGEFALHNGERDQAREILQQLISTCGPEEVVHAAAIAELKLLPPK